MTRLINFGTGEICDRLSILALKILHAERAGHDATHFRTEQDALIARLTSRKGGVHAEVWRGLFGLAAVNGRLWEAEDEMRGHRARGVAAPTMATITCAFAIQELNDRRAHLVQGINEAMGEHLGAEKTPEAEVDEPAPLDLDALASMGDDA